MQINVDIIIFYGKANNENKTQDNCLYISYIRIWLVILKKSN